MFSVLIIDSIYNIIKINSAVPGASALLYTSTSRAKHDFGIFGDNIWTYVH